jgi:hypothetical protein
MAVAAGDLLRGIATTGDTVTGSDDRDGQEGWLDTLGRLPWWLCVAVGIVSYCALHALSMRPQAIVVDEAGVGAMLAALLLGGLGESLQLFVPALCLSALLAGFLRRPALCGEADPCVAGADNAMTAWEFERLTGGGLRARRRRGRPLAAIPQ